MLPGDKASGEIRRAYAYTAAKLTAWKSSTLCQVGMASAIGVGRYRAVWQLPDARRLVFGGFIGRLPIGVTPIAIILAVHQAYGSYITAGIAVGTYNAGFALGAPVLGRLADRYGAPLVLWLASAAHLPVIVVLVVSISTSWSLGMVWTTALCVGLTAPPTSPAVRSAWNALTAGPGQSLRRVALSLDSVSFELCFIVAPLVVGVFGLSGRPVLALLASGTFAAIGAMLIASGRHINRARQESSAAFPRSGPSAIFTPGIPTLLVVTAALGFALGALDITLPAFSSAHVSAASAGGIATALFALSSVGSVTGALWFGTKHFTAALATQWAYTLAALTAGLVMLSVVTNIPMMMVMIVICSAPIAAVATVETSMVAAIVAPSALNEAYSWNWTITVVAVGAGQVLTGAVVEHFGSAMLGFLLAAAGPALGAVVAALPRSKLRQAEAGAQKS
ncbi:MAG: hypothetical protein DLM55_02880 [Acidimicrobiales bacterium]|nr:MAG: hypothetical protein DLM55_02880 [Acidimicrobiales bacterium]